MPHRVTRRRLLATGALAGAGLVLPGSAAASTAWAAARGRPTSFGLDVPGRAFAGGRVTGVLRAPRRFDLLGVRGAGVRDAGLEVRARRPDGTWSRWAPLEVTRHGPDGRGPLAASEPVWVGSADAFQLRARRPLGGLRVQFVAVPPGVGGGASARAASSARASQATGAPAIIGRDIWEAGRCPPRNPPSYGEVQLAFVHHTVSANDYAPEDSAGIVLSICKYHRDSNGWNDLGYNFVVDQYGQIFEGRAGGIDQAVIGAQCEGFNRLSTGVANLGTFSAVPQSEAALNALGALIGWKLGVHGVPTTGQVTVTSGGGKTNRYASGTAATFERISGHRDGCNTACPGDALYAQLVTIRERAARVTPAVAAVARLSLATGTRSVVYGHDAVFTGRLVGPDGAPVGGAAISVQKLGASGTFSTIARATTDGDGSWSARAPWRAGGAVRARARPAGARAPVRSPQVTIAVVPLVSATAATTRIQAGTTIAIAGQVRPHAAARVLIERDAGGGVYARVAEVPLTVRATRFAAPIRLRRAGLYRLTVRTGQGASVVSAAPVFVRAVKDIKRTPSRGSSGGAASPGSAAPPTGGISASS
jgi:hypothetical protein